MLQHQQTPQKSKIQVHQSHDESSKEKDERWPIKERSYKYDYMYERSSRADEPTLLLLLLVLRRSDRRWFLPPWPHCLMAIDNWNRQDSIFSDGYFCGGGVCTVCVIIEWHRLCWRHGSNRIWSGSGLSWIKNNLKRTKKKWCRMMLS